MASLGVKCLLVSLLAWFSATFLVSGPGRSPYHVGSSGRKLIRRGGASVSRMSFYLVRLAPGRCTRRMANMTLMHGLVLLRDGHVRLRSIARALNASPVRIRAAGGLSACTRLTCMADSSMTAGPHGLYIYAAPQDQ